MLHLNKIQKEDHMHAAFSYFDEDGSGYITQDELQNACDKFGLSNILIEELMREVDQDNHGRIDYSEFVAMMQHTGFGEKVHETETIAARSTIEFLSMVIQEVYPEADSDTILA